LDHIKISKTLGEFRDEAARQERPHVRPDMFTIIGAMAELKWSLISERVTPRHEGSPDRGGDRTANCDNHAVEGDRRRKGLPSQL
jgi:hypothetical protein